MMDRTFDYLNRYYLKNNNIEEISEKCMRAFHDKSFTRKKDEITKSILDMISRDRKGDEINKEIVKKSIQIFVDLGLVKPKAMRNPKTGTFLW